MTGKLNISRLAKSLTPGEGKVLRYASSRGMAIQASSTVNTIEWSDLPSTLMEATKFLHKLLDLGLVEREGSDFAATSLGNKVVKYANVNGMWKQPPPPSVTRPRNRRK